MVDDEKVAEARDPDGRAVVLSTRTWARILDGHPEMLDRLDSVIETIADPETSRAGPAA